MNQKAPEYGLKKFIPLVFRKDLSKAERVGMWEEAHRRKMGALFENGLVGVVAK